MARAMGVQVPLPAPDFCVYEMKIKCVKKKQCLSVYEVYANQDYISAEYDKHVKEASSSVEIPGFRKGSIPRDIIEQKYSGKILEIVADSLYRKAVSELVSGELKDKIVRLEEYSSLNNYTKSSIKISFEVYTFPEIPTIKYDKMKFSVPDAQIADSDILKDIDLLAKRFGSFDSVDENIPLHEGDVAVIDFIGRLNNEVIPEATSNNYKLEIGSNQFVPGFESQLVGMITGEEKTIKVHFPSDYTFEKFKDKEVEFDIHLRSIQKIIPHELNDELAKKAGSESLNSLRESISNRIRNSIENSVKARLRKKVDDVLLEKYCDFDIPSFLLANIKNDKNELKKESAEICLRYIYRDIIHQNNITASKTEVDEIIMYEALKSGQDFAKIKSELEKNKNVVSYIESSICESKAFDVIYSKISLSKEKCNLDDAFKFIDKM